MGSIHDKCFERNEKMYELGKRRERIGSMDEKLQRAIKDGVFWMQRYYALRGLVNGVIMSAGQDDFKTAQIGELLKNEEYQDAIMFPVPVRPEINSPEKSVGKV